MQISAKIILRSGRLFQQNTIRHVFMAAFIRNGVVDSISGGIYSYLMRYHIADNLARGVPIDATQSIMQAVKYLYGATCLMGCLFLLLLMLWHVQPVRSTLKHLPYWNKLGQQMREELASFQIADYERLYPLLKETDFPDELIMNYWPDKFFDYLGIQR